MDRLQSVVLYTSDEILSDNVATILAATGWGSVSTVADVDACLAMAMRDRRSVVCLDTGESPEHALELADILHAQAPDVMLMVLTRSGDFRLAREALRRGALDVLVLPDELAALPDMLARAFEQRAARESAATRRGHVVAVYSAKGGSGCTFLATNLALTQSHQRKVLLIDMNLQFGGVDAMLGLSFDRSVVDLLPVMDELNETHLRNVVCNHPSGLDILLPPRNGVQSVEMTPEQVRMLLMACRHSYDTVLIDLPSGITPAIHAALLEADQVLYIATPDAISLHTLKRALAWLAGPLQARRVSLVVNRASSISEVQARDIAKVVELPIVGEVRAGYREVQSMVNVGAPLVGQKATRRLSAPARDIIALSDRISR